MTTPAAEERRTWFPLVLAGVFVVITIGIALFAFLNNRTGDPSRASTVDDVAELSIEAVERRDLDFAGELLCETGSVDLAAVFDHGADAVGEKSSVTGVETGTFVLTVGSEEYAVTVAQDGDRSCIERATVRD